MELIAKKKYSDILKELISIKKDLKINADKTKGIKDAVENMPLLVPVVGEFNAGKSTLLNSMIGKDILGVDMKPETAIPAELYYSENEFDEGVKSDGTSEVITDIENAPKKYSYLRRHINSQFLKAIEPIVLVDMPGFDSPLDAHNKAIVCYLDRGIHYAMLIPSDAGTITNSMKRQVQNIVAFKKECTFFMSKTDLLSQEELEEVKEKIQEELYSVMDKDVDIKFVRHNDTKLFSQFINGISPETLIKKQFSSIITEECNDTKDSINTMVAAIKMDSSKQEQTIQKIVETMDKIKEKKEEMIEKAEKKDFAREAGDIADAVKRDLNAEIDSIVSAAKVGPETYSSKINEIAQSSLLLKLNGTMEEISVNYNDEFCAELTDLKTLVSDSLGDSKDELVGKFKDSVRDFFDTSANNVREYITKKRKSLLPVSAGYKTFTGILAAATSIVNPAVEIAIILLPEIINSLYAFIIKHKREEEIKNWILEQIPTIGRKVREQASKCLKENSKKTIEAISLQYDEKLQDKKEEFEKALKRKERDEERIKEQITKCSQYLERIDSLLS